MKAFNKSFLLGPFLLLTGLYSDGSARPKRRFSKPSEGKIAFQVNTENGSDIYLRGGSGRHLRNLTKRKKGVESDDSQPALSRDGRKIVFTSVQNGNQEIYLMKSDGTYKRRLTRHAAQDFAPTWSPDGRKIAFLSTRGRPREEDRGQDIYWMNADGSGLKRLTSERLSPDIWGLSWSPDGRKIAFTVNLHQGGRSPIGPISLHVMNVDGTGVKRLTKTFTNDIQPCFSPNGRKIVFRSDEGIGGSSDIHIINADGTGRTRLTRTIAPNPADNTDEEEPVWSPDGRKIAFSCVLSNAEIYVMNSDGSGIRRITAHNIPASHPSWSR